MYLCMFMCMNYFSFIATLYNSTQQNSFSLLYTVFIPKQTFSVRLKFNILIHKNKRKGNFCVERACGILERQRNTSHRNIFISFCIHFQFRKSFRRVQFYIFYTRVLLARFVNIVWFNFCHKKKQINVFLGKKDINKKKRKKLTC